MKVTPLLRVLSWTLSYDNQVNESKTVRQVKEQFKNVWPTHGKYYFITVIESKVSAESALSRVLMFLLVVVAVITLHRQEEEGRCDGGGGGLCGVLRCGS